MNNAPTSLSKILNGISSTLNIANKALPLYQESKPLLKTINQTYKNFKKNKDNLKNIMNLMKVNKQIKNEPKVSKIANNKRLSRLISTKKNYTQINNPKFFI